MDPDLTYQDLRQNKIIENLFNIIRTVGSSTHYVQQACISNLLVTVFAALRLDNFLITDTFLTLTSCGYGRPTLRRTNRHTAHDDANTAP
jgi:hypothetical protein